MILEALYKARLEESKKHERKMNEVWVTDLTRCPLKRVFEEKYPDIRIAPFNSIY